jgi:hypothetical protein
MALLECMRELMSTLHAGTNLDIQEYEATAAKHRCQLRKCKEKEEEGDLQCLHC